MMEANHALAFDPLPVSGPDRCYNGNCGGAIEFTDGKAVCEKCEVFIRLVAAAPSGDSKSNVLKMSARAKSR
jgi:hypothetical protein